jgi:hypothetical protein
VIKNRDFIRAATENANCWVDDPLYLAVNDAPDLNHIILDLFADPSRKGGLTLRVTHREGAESFTRDLQIQPASARAAAQFLLRRLRELDPNPAGAIARFKRQVIK